MIQVTSEERIQLLATMAVEIFKGLKEERLDRKAILAVDVAHGMLEDVTKRVNER